MAGKTDKKKLRSKFFRVAVEGATTDGRVIERQHITDMAASYDPQLYGARIWVEHMRSLMPDGPFKAFGDVLAVKAEEVEIGGVKKLALFAQIEPTDALVAMVNNDKQKLYTSIEIAPKFADTGKAYLQGLAVTDTPASLGTEMLAFAAQQGDKSPLASRKQTPGNLFTAMEETEISFDEVEQPAARPSKLAILMSGIGRLTKPEPEPTPKEDPNADFGKFADQLVATFTAQEERIEQLSAKNDELTAKVKALGEQVTGFRKTLDDTPQTFSQRPPISGSGGSVGDATDC
ncbi:GPO family capsid scaffolding protein [Stenotrophomonas maltophilia]|uniref:GPO family capsid scaffolding protein n=1 Tax=Stenotrophomonas maltophilia TaxID=40324 RepID=UPI0024473AD8|nr:GPO family capsid scaffolding protein [Stenotrophomonas maltophilia]MDH0071533.1 GPO family capsid scaffolding protein [Stenotrophomonas maltophilia]MDH0104851.1 GPO family capsid scaffolding protein [Stenotrophomonas maltophilia]MDH0330691.1 GPO family capsid scaffolding protein [Stenotrophomonas maltophilia]MDH0631874.1 GPO family capsid scaffolding protein [Stenotrophomonas maltophilia]MDH0641333.1 GPO family capsid scaffolding protein [Stenotrophomonas maltophilia]